VVPESNSPSSCSNPLLRPSEGTFLPTAEPATYRPDSVAMFSTSSCLTLSLGPVKDGHMSNYHDDIARFAEIFRALSNPNRLEIFLRLVSCCPPGTKCEAGIGLRQCVGELGKGLEIDPSTVSHHIRELRQSGLIRMERRGKNMLCWVDPETAIATANLLTGCSMPDRIEKDECLNLGECK
jgi:ArsR family transcriptional regulator, arsenate/arsenite/antimonite-responsive transcriptional repressor